MGRQHMRCCPLDADAMTRKPPKEMSRLPETFAAITCDMDIVALRINP